MRLLPNLAAAAAAVALLAPAARAEADQRISAPAPLRRFGLMLDGGAPSGAGLSAVVRPLGMLKLHGGLAWDYVGFGLRGGATLIPFEWAVTPTLGADVGHFFSGDASSFTTNPGAKLLLKDISYNYESLLVGLEFGSQRSFTFFLKGGLTWLQTEGHNVAQAINAENSGGNVTVKSADPVQITAHAPTVTLGFTYFIF